MRQRNRPLQQLMAKYGYVLVREKNHAVWRNPTTRHQMITSLTAGDRRVLQQIEADLKRKHTHD